MKSHLNALCLWSLIVTGSVAAEKPAANNGREWPTLHGDLTRSGYYPQFPPGSLELVWRKELHRELTGTRAEVIVGDGLAFMGSYAGKMYAWDAATGTQKWIVETDGPIGHSPMYDNRVLYFGSMDRGLYAVQTRDGKQKWKFTAGEGIWTSPVVFDGRVYFGDREGTFYALDASNGQPVWQLKTGDRILTPASISPDGRFVVFGSEDMHVYCADVETGKLAWKSRQLAGLSLRDHAPTMAGDLVIVTTNPVKSFHAALNEHQSMLLKRTGVTGKEPRYVAGTAEDVRREQDAILDYLKAHPEDQTFYALRLADGKQPWVAPIFYTSGLHNPPTPPCFNPRTGEVFVYVRSAYTTWDGGGEVRPLTGVGKLNTQTGRVQLLDHGYQSKDPNRPAGRKDMPWMSFNTIGDETQALSCSPGVLLSNHQGYLGSLNLKTGQTSNRYGKRDTYGGFYGPGIYGWENQGGREKARRAGDPFGLVNEWHGPDKAIVSVAGPYVYFPVGSQVLCLKGKP